jgi:hypothetical protein
LQSTHVALSLTDYRQIPPSLEIALRTQVTRVLFKKKTAIGVEARRGHQTFKIKAR